MFICTLTSWRARINIVADTIQSLLDNTFKPDKIVLNLSREEFPRMDEELPRKLIDLCLHNPVEIYWVNGNAKAFKKLIPTLDRYREAIVMTNDDDIIYPKDFLAEVTSHYTFEKPQTLNRGKLWGSGYGTMYEYRFFGKYLHAFDRKEVWKTNEDDIAYGVLMLLNGYTYSHYAYNFKKIFQVDEAHGMCANQQYNSQKNEVWFNNYIKHRYGVDFAWLRNCIANGIRFELTDREPVTNDMIIQTHLPINVKPEPAPANTPVVAKESVIIEKQKPEPTPEQRQEESRQEKKRKFLGEIKHIAKDGEKKTLKKFISRR